MSLPDLASLRMGGKRAIAHALSALETHAGTLELARLIDAACAAPRAMVLGITGPPGVGKSTLTNALVKHWRQRGETVAVLAIDPSSRKSGGALLGDRARITTDPDDRGVFVRSMAARDRLGGLSDQTIAAMVLMRALYDHVLIESVGIGQSETDISFAADTVLLCIQPGSGDSLQFMKAGVMELPDIVAVTKADMGEVARRAIADVKGALTLTQAQTAWQVPVLGISAPTGEGMDMLADAIAGHADWLIARHALPRQRQAQHSAWLEDAIKTRFGSFGLAAARRLPTPDGGPFEQAFHLGQQLAQKLSAS